MHTRQSQLGDFLRSRRERLSAGTLGLSTARRRRTPGLRREEVAELAGIGVDWYIRLEQGRSVHPSPTTVNALARALRLSPAEHAHLQALILNGGRPAFARETVPVELERLIKNLNHPAYITGQRWDMLAWNSAATEVFLDFGLLAEEDRNILLYVLTNPDARSLFGAGWADQAKRMLALFRGTHDLWASDPAFQSLVRRLRQGCDKFSIWWEEHEISTPVSGHKVFHHPHRGILQFEYATFQANDDPALKLAIYTLL